MSEPVIHHEFKSAPSVFYPAKRGTKMFEFRKDDRGGYHVGQNIRLRCYEEGIGYTDEAPLDRTITNILYPGEFGLQDGYCILGLAPLAAGADAGDWMPIAMAPKDGSDILILAPGEAFVGFWREKDGAWFVSDYHDQHQWQGYAPTHWMPVPSAPSGWPASLTPEA